MTFFAKRSIEVAGLTMRLPSVGEALEDEQSFWREASLFTRSPYDLMSELDKLGLDFEKTSDYEVFTLLLLYMQKTGALGRELFFKFPLSSLIFDGERFLSPDTGDYIDEARYNELSAAICKMLCRTKTLPVKFGNALAKRKRIELDALKKSGKQSTGASLEAAALRLVCSGRLPYGFGGIAGITVYELLCALRQLERDELIAGLSAAGADTSQISRYVI